MALLSGLRSQDTETPPSIPLAIMIPLVGAMLADGRVEPQEISEIHSICASSPIFQRNSKFENEFLISEATRIIEHGGVENACKLAKKTLSPGLCETAFVHAMRVIYSDGYVGPLEHEIAGRMTGWLEIDPKRAQLMVEVVSVMQHTATV